MDKCITVSWWTGKGIFLHKIWSTPNFKQIAKITYNEELDDLAF